MKTLDRSNMEHRFRHFAPIFVATIVGSVLSFTAWFVISASEKRDAESEFFSTAADQALALQNGLKEYLSKMIAVRALFNASNTVSRKEFGIFSDTLLHGQTAILGFSWVPRIRLDERSANELAAAHDGLADYRIKAVAPEGRLVLSPERDEYYPVFYSNALSKASAPCWVRGQERALRNCRRSAVVGTQTRFGRRLYARNSIRMDQGVRGLRRDHAGRRR
jgi:CHASE1-domain containing sensor protein